MSELREAAKKALVYCEGGNYEPLPDIISALRKAIANDKDENSRLRYDVDRHLAIATEYISENEWLEHNLATIRGMIQITENQHEYKVLNKLVDEVLKITKEALEKEELDDEYVQLAVNRLPERLDGESTDDMLKRLGLGGKDEQ